MLVEFVKLRDKDRRGKEGIEGERYVYDTKEGRGILVCSGGDWMENLALHSPIGAIISLSLWGGGMRARLTFADHFLHLGKYGIYSKLQWGMPVAGDCRSSGVEVYRAIKNVGTNDKIRTGPIINPRGDGLPLMMIGEGALCFCDIYVLNTHAKSKDEPHTVVRRDSSW